MTGKYDYAGRLIPWCDVQNLNATRLTFYRNTLKRFDIFSFDNSIRN